MLLKLVINKCLQDFIHSTKSGTLTILVTIVSLPSQLVTFSSFISKEVWDAHDREHTCWARDHISPKSKIDSGALTILVTIVSMPLQLVTPCRFKLQRLVTYVTIVSSNIMTVSRHSAGFPRIVWNGSCGRWRPTQRLQQLYFWRVVYINSLPKHKWKVKHS